MILFDSIRRHFTFVGPVNKTDNKSFVYWKLKINRYKVHNRNRLQIFQTQQNLTDIDKIDVC